MGPVRQAIGLPEPRVHDLNARNLGRVLPGRSGGLVDTFPCFASPADRSPPVSRSRPSVHAIRWAIGAVETADPSSRPQAPNEAGEHARTAAQAPLKRHDYHPQGDRRRAAGWIADQLERRRRGASPDRGQEAIMLPRRDRLMRIRKDGIRRRRRDRSFCRTQKGARLYCSYGGIFDAWCGRLRSALLGKIRRAAHVRRHSD